MKIVIPGGSGQIGMILARHLSGRGHEVVVLSRSAGRDAEGGWRCLRWDGRTMGAEWMAEVDGADAVIHLSGRTVNCRYTAEHRREIYDSRVETTRIVGEAIAGASRPPKVWLNASTSTIYRHALDRGQDEFTGEMARWTGGPATGEEEGLPETWSFSADVGRRWEGALRAAATPGTRRIALRTSMVMSPDAGGVFAVLSGLVGMGLGGTQGPGTQYVSWMHDADYARAVELLLERPEIADETAGVVNMTAPGPVLNAEFMRELRQAWGMPVGLPAARWMLEVGAVFLRTETELILKSRRVMPGVLGKYGFVFRFPEWAGAARDLVGRMRAKKQAF